MVSLNIILPIPFLALHNFCNWDGHEWTEGRTKDLRAIEGVREEDGYRAVPYLKIYSVFIKYCVFLKISKYIPLSV